MKPIIFREYDIRGIVGQDFELSEASRIGQAFASLVSEKAGSRIVVGHDGRLTSPALTQEIINGLVASGAEVTFIGLCPTPQLYFAAHFYNADGAMMITGSHNPPEYNGCKLVIQKQSLFGQAIQDLCHRIQTQQFIKDTGTVHPIDMQEEYLQYLLSDFKAHYSGKNLTVAWDPANGAASEILRRLIPHLPGHHHLINDQVDGTFPNHHPDPTLPQNLAQLITIVQNNQCDLGIGFDGDGDRIGVVDARGRIVYGDQLLALFAEEVLENLPGATIMADVKSSQQLFNAISRLGGTPLMWRTGHSLIKTKMKELSCPLAGEMSGHIMFADRYYGFDDALYAALRLLGILMRKQESLAEWLDQWPCVHSTHELHIPCGNLNKFEIAAQLRANLQQQGICLNDIDGVRVTQPDGWWLLRPSNTQEILTARAESTSQKGLEKLLHSIEKALAHCGIIVKINDLIHGYNIHGIDHKTYSSDFKNSGRRPSGEPEERILIRDRG